MPMRLSICKTCGRQFLNSFQEANQYCRVCNDNRRQEQERIREENERLESHKKKEREHEIFESTVLNHCPVDIECIHPSKRTLYIIGNGFDLMHRVQSSYYSFRDSLGKSNSLRWMLETTLTPDDIWADFENSLGLFDLDQMGSRHIVDMWLNYFDVYNANAKASDFYAAVEAAANPIINIVNDLPHALNKWVSKLRIGTDDRPLKKLICPEGKALSFNYTEFIETLYSVKDVCYIHGCRKNRNSGLIIGHKPGDEGVFREKNKKPRSYHQALVSIAQDNVLDLIGQYNEDLTKNSREIIKNNRAFFDKLTDIDQVVVIGHSLSPIDWDYFSEVSRLIPDANWYFGVFGLNDLKNLEDLAKKLELKRYNIFRTDGIVTKPRPVDYDDAKSASDSRSRVFKEGSNKVTIDRNYCLTICGDLELVLPYQVRTVIFLYNHILIVLNDSKSSLLLFSKKNDGWHFVTQLESFKYQSLINRRLNHVFLTERNLTFVYNNRVRTYELASGAMTFNRQIKNARNKKFIGVDIISKLIGQKNNYS